MKGHRPAEQAPLPGLPALALHQLAGEQAQEHGDEGEAIADKMHKLCFDRGVAEVWRVSSHIKIGKPTGRHPDEHYAYVKPGPGSVDCRGAMADGREVQAEVKHLRQQRRESGNGLAPLRLDLSRVKEHQQAQLARCEARGGVAVILCTVHELLAFAVPWRVARAVLVSGRASLDEATLRAHTCVPLQPYLREFARPRSP